MTRSRTGFGAVLLAAGAGCSGLVSEGRLAPPDSAVAPQTSSPVPGWGLEVAPPPRALVFVEVTPAAAREVRSHVADRKLERWWLRYTMTPGGCTGLLRKLDLDAGPPTAADVAFVADGVPCLVLKSQQHLVQGTRIDFGTKDGQRGFIVTDPHATEGTKAAVAKWIACELDKRNADQPPTDTN